MAYQFEHSWQYERERLAAIEGGLDAYSVASLAAIGVGEGWRCLEIGAGAGSIARWLCDRVGPRGRVVATDLETELLAKLSVPQLEVRRHDITKDPLESEAFDLVHARKVLEHLSEPERVLARMVAALKPGGSLLVEDADLVSLMECSGVDRSFFARAYGAFIATMESNGYHAALGLGLARLLREAGLVDVQSRGWCNEWTGAGPAPSVFLRTFEKVSEQVVRQGRLTAEEAGRLLEAIRSPSFRATTAIHFAVWGCRPPG